MVTVSKTQFLNYLEKNNLKAKMGNYMHEIVYVNKDG